MSDKRPFQTTTAAEFREIAKAARSSGRLSELIEAINSRIVRHRSMLELHEAARDIRQIRETKRVITNLESKLEIARQIENRAELD